MKDNEFAIAFCLAVLMGLVFFWYNDYRLAQRVDVLESHLGNLEANAATTRDESTAYGQLAARLSSDESRLSALDGGQTKEWDCTAEDSGQWLSEHPGAPWQDIAPDGKNGILDTVITTTGAETTAQLGYYRCTAIPKNLEGLVGGSSDNSILNVDQWQWQTNANCVAGAPGC